MFKIKIADFIVEIHNSYDFIFRQCSDYIYDGEENADIIATCTQEQIDDEKKIITDACYSDGYIESICLYRSLCLQLPAKDAFVMHAAVISVDGKGYAFTAKSGTGKSTHILQWHGLLGDKVVVVNGDKPILRFLDGKLYVYGTPWCGKEGWNTNTRAELCGLCFLERAENNFIEPIPSKDAANRIMKQILLSKDSLGVIKTLDMVDKMIMNTKIWRLGCNVSIDAAKVAYKAMSGGKYED